MTAALGISCADNDVFMPPAPPFPHCTSGLCGPAIGICPHYSGLEFICKATPFCCRMGTSECCLTESKPSSPVNTSSFTKPGKLLTPVPDTWPFTFAKTDFFQVSCYGQVQILPQLKCSSHTTSPKLYVCKGIAYRWRHYFPGMSNRVAYYDVNAVLTSIECVLPTSMARLTRLVLA